MLTNVSDATIQLVGVSWLVGYVVGMVTIAFIFWRPITRSRHESRDLRLLRLQLEDSDRQLTAAFEQNNRLARMLSEAKGRTGGRAA